MTGNEHRAALQISPTCPQSSNELMTHHDPWVGSVTPAVNSACAPMRWLMVDTAAVRVHMRPRFIESESLSPPATTRVPMSTLVMLIGTYSLY